MGRPDYAVKCFIEALAIKEEFETMGYLSQLYIQMGGKPAKARELLEKMAAMEPDVTSTFLTLAKCMLHPGRLSGYGRKAAQ